ncbi:MAG: hypothetical protein EXS18_04060 [Verrucomicrobiae bacterium]|nr:hypothetical protein [Verrucomicrobiae bacterium]
MEQFVARCEAIRKSDPINGPIFVEGAKPGDTLVVDIQCVEWDKENFRWISPAASFRRTDQTPAPRRPVLQPLLCLHTLAG